MRKQLKTTTAILAIALLGLSACKNKNDDTEVKTETSVEVVEKSKPQTESKPKTESTIDYSDALKKMEEALAEAASTQGDGDPAMWKMADADTTIYLYGTFHLLPEDVEWQTQEFKDALNSSDTVYFEIDMSPEKEQAMAFKLLSSATYSDGTKLKDHMTQDQYDALAAAGEELEIPVQVLNLYEPWFAGLTIQVSQLQKDGFDPTKGVESVIMETVDAQGKTVGELETIDDQIVALSGGTREEQVAALMFGLETMDKSSEMTRLLMAEWADGDMQGLDLLMGEDMFATREGYELLLVNRNRNWIPKIESILDEPGTKFIAVGAGHLAGPDSVIRMLEDKGHTLEVIQ